MYYLNEKHPEYEYVLFIQVKNACPYLMYDDRPLKSIDQVLEVVERIEKKHSRYYNGLFYIDNDFYENKYDSGFAEIYYKFMRREVHDWQDFKTKEENIIHLNFCNKNVIKRIK